MEANDIITYYQWPANQNLQNASPGSQQEKDLLQTVLLAERAVQLALMNTRLDSISNALYSMSTAIHLK